MVAIIDTAAFVKPKALFGMRHVQTLLLFVCWILTAGMRVNMSIAIVSMTDTKNEQHFDWSLQIRSVILSSFYWSYMILQIPGGVLVNKFGGSRLIIINLGVNSAITILIPFAAYYGGWQLVCACRVLQGLLQGLLVPACHNLISKWAPIPEKSRITAFIYSGSYIGMAIQYLISGFIADIWGWSAIFYIVGSCGAVFTVIYMILGDSSPEHSKYISKEEKMYIQTSLGQVGEQKKLQTPWKSIFKSVPYLATCISHCGIIWGYTTMITETPSYLNHVLGIDIKANGILSSLSYLIMFILCFFFGLMSDLMINKGWCSVTVTRKVSNTVGTYGPALGMIALSYTPAEHTVLAIVLITVIIALSVGLTTGTLLVFLDISPNFAGILLGMANGVSNIASIIAPLAAGMVLKDETDPEEWRKVFFIAAAVYIVGNTTYLIFGTSKQQKWNNPEPEVKDIETIKANEKER